MTTMQDHFDKNVVARNEAYRTDDEEWRALQAERQAAARELRREAYDPSYVETVDGVEDAYSHLDWGAEEREAINDLLREATTCSGRRL